MHNTLMGEGLSQATAPGEPPTAPTVPDDDLYAVTCAWLDQSVGYAGAGPVVLSLIMFFSAALLWKRIFHGTRKEPDQLGQKVRQCRATTWRVRRRVAAGAQHNTV